MVKNGYIINYVNFLFLKDDLPLMGYVGFAVRANAGEYYLYTHNAFTVTYNHDRVCNFTYCYSLRFSLSVFPKSFNVVNTLK